MFRGRNIHYEWNDRVRGLGAGGTRVMHLLVQRMGLAAEIDGSLKLLQVHQPYHERITCCTSPTTSCVVARRLRISSNCGTTRWTRMRSAPVLGIDAMPKLVTIAPDLSTCAWTRLQRPAKYAGQTEERSHRENVKDRVACERGFESIRLKSEDVAEFRYQPGA